MSLWVPRVCDQCFCWLEPLAGGGGIQATGIPFGLVTPMTWLPCSPHWQSQNWIPPPWKPGDPGLIFLFWGGHLSLSTKQGRMAPWGSLISERGSRSVVSDSLQPHGLHSPWNSPGQNTAFPFSRESSQPRDWTQVSHIAGRYFISWAKREAQEYWSG